MAVIIMPANMLPICPMAVKIAVLFAISNGLLNMLLLLNTSIYCCTVTYYHDPRIYIVPL
jgi:hypothetical protein